MPEAGRPVRAQLSTQEVLFPEYSFQTLPPRQGDYLFFPAQLDDGTKLDSSFFFPFLPLKSFLVPSEGALRDAEALLCSQPHPGWHGRGEAPQHAQDAGGPPLPAPHPPQPLPQRNVRGHPAFSLPAPDQTLSVPHGVLAAVASLFPVVLSSASSSPSLVRGPWKEGTAPCASGEPLFRFLWLLGYFRFDQQGADGLRQPQPHSKGAPRLPGARSGTSVCRELTWTAC